MVIGVGSVDVDFEGVGEGVAGCVDALSIVGWICSLRSSCSLQSGCSLRLSKSGGESGEEAVLNNSPDGSCCGSGATSRGTGGRVHQMLEQLFVDVLSELDRQSSQLFLLNRLCQRDIGKCWHQRDNTTCRY